MNILAAVSILLVTILAFQTTVINGAKSLAEHKHHSSSKEHLAIETPPRASSNSGVLSRVGRGAKSSPNQGSESGVGKRGKNNKKLNKSTHLENPNASATSAQSTSSDLNSPDRVQQTPQQQGPKHQQGAGAAASSGAQQHNGKPKQKQLLKSQQHQSHVKRGGGSGNKAVGDKKPDEQKQSSCRYSKSAWTECDAKTNSRSRTLTLKRGESNCLQTRTIQKKCKKACRYEKGGWTECTAGQMTRQDKLKTTSDPTCEAVRSINKKCNPGGKPKDKGNKERKNKDKGSRKAAAA